MKFEWEIISTLTSSNTYRAEIFGGWIVTKKSYADGDFKSECMVFIPDPEHKWEITED